MLFSFQVFLCQYAQCLQRGAAAAARRWSLTSCPGPLSSSSWPWRREPPRSHLPWELKRQKLKVNSWQYHMTNHIICKITDLYFDHGIYPIFSVYLWFNQPLLWKCYFADEQKKINLQKSDIKIVISHCLWRWANPLSQFSYLQINLNGWGILA